MPASNVLLARGGTGPTDVHSSYSRAISDPIPFHTKTRDQADSLSFSVKRPFQNEIDGPQGRIEVITHLDEAVVLENPFRACSGSPGLPNVDPSRAQVSCPVGNISHAAVSVFCPQVMHEQWP